MTNRTAVYVPARTGTTERACERMRVERELVRNGYNHLHRVIPAHASRALAHALDCKAVMTLASKEANRQAYQARKHGHALTQTI